MLASPFLVEVMIMRKISKNELIDFLSKNQSKPIGKHEYLSVLVPFVEKDGELYILYEERSKKMKMQPGEVCFPGGHMEIGESPKNCAIRETSEELGISKDNIKIISQGNTIYGYSGYILYAFFGVIQYEDYLSAKIEKEEVEKIFLISLKTLIETEPKKYQAEITAKPEMGFPYEVVGASHMYKWKEGRWQIPIYQVDDEVIWGMTGKITENLIIMLKNAFQEF